MAKVFICHAMQDDAVAQRIYDKLTAAGIRAWLDNAEIEPEADWLVQVEAAVKESSHGLFLLSPAAVNSPAAMREYHKLLMADKPMYIALVEPLQSVADLPYYLRDVAYCDLTTEFEAGVACLVSILRENQAHFEPQALRDAEQRDITITLQANLRDLDNDKFIDLIARLVDVGIKDIKVINVTAG